MPTPSPTSIVMGGVKSAMVKMCEAKMISPRAEPTAKRAVTSGTAAATREPKSSPRMITAATMPAISAIGASFSSAPRTASPPSSTWRLPDSMSWAVSMILATCAFGTASVLPSSVTVA